MRRLISSAMTPTDPGPPGLAMTSIAPSRSASTQAADPCCVIELTTITGIGGGGGIDHLDFGMIELEARRPGQPGQPGSAHHVGELACEVADRRVPDQLVRLDAEKGAAQLARQIHRHDERHAALERPAE